MDSKTNRAIKQRIQRRKQRGISTVQVAIGIMVSVIILMGAIGGYQYVNQGKVNNEIAAINDMKVGMVRFGASSTAAFAANAVPTLNTLNAFGVFSNPMFRLTEAAGAVTGVTNQWSGAVTVAFGTADRLDFTFASVPASACADVAGKVDNIADTVSVTRGGNTTVTKAAGGRTDAAALATACGTSGTVSILYGLSR